MRRRTFPPAAAFLIVLGCAATSLASCTEADCADLATCEAPATGDAGTDAAKPARDAGATEPASPPAKNPYGQDYPTENLGWTPRARGSSTPGNVIPNVVFQTALEGTLRAPVGGSDLRKPKPLQLADLFDPEERAHDVIVLVLATTWDSKSKQFFEELRSTPHKTVIVSVLGERTPTGEPATTADLLSWAEAHYLAWSALDGGFTRLAKLQERARSEMPIIALIDATTMELASFSAGGLSADALNREIEAIRLRQ
jgi:hypothetical protein